MTELEPAHLRTLRKSGIQPPFRLYDLRHTYGTRGRSGHRCIQRGETHGPRRFAHHRRYVHLSKSHLKDAQKRIERFRLQQQSL
jgi:integrase